MEAQAADPAGHGYLPKDDEALEDVAAETKARSSKDPELDAIRRISNILDPLTLKGKERVLTFIASRHIGLPEDDEFCQ